MTFSPETTRAWVDVDLAALVANARTVAAVSGSRLLPMVKANGYGLGATEVARALEALDPWGFGVASIDEARVLRASGIVRPILVMTPLQPQAIRQYLDLDLRPSIGDVPALESWIATGSKPFHVEIDTGMSRAGVRWDDRASVSRLATLFPAAKGWEGAFTHFLAAESDLDGSKRQWDRFQEVLRVLPGRPPLIHASNSAGALRESSSPVIWYAPVSICMVAPPGRNCRKRLRRCGLGSWPSVRLPRATRSGTERPGAQSGRQGWPRSGWATRTDFHVPVLPRDPIRYRATSS